VQVAGSPSWRFSSDVPDSLLVALYVRDVNGLDVPAGGAVPPSLDARLPAARAVRHGRAVASVQWRDWWHALVDERLASERRASTLPGFDVRSRMREMMAARLVVYDPPEFGALADSPELHTLAQSGFAEANRLFARRRGSLSGEFDYEIVRAVAEDVARAYDVSPDAVRASAQVPPVAGLRWRRVRSGAVLCSISSARDDGTARALLRDAFESGLGG
jgi:hypothetical protein